MNKERMMNKTNKETNKQTLKEVKYLEWPRNLPSGAFPGFKTPGGLFKGVLVESLFGLWGRHVGMARTRCSCGEIQVDVRHHGRLPHPP